MNRAERESYLHEIENNYPVNSWIKGGIHLWPLIKVKLSLALNRNNKNCNIQYYGRLSFLLKLIKSIFYFLSLRFQKSRIANDIYCSAPHFRYKHGNQYKHRYFNGLKSRCGNNFLVIEYNSKNKDYKKNIEDLDKTIFLSDLMPMFLFIREVKWIFHSKRNNFAKYDGFIQDIKLKLNVNDGSYKSIIRQYLLIKTIKSFYVNLIKKYKVQNIYILCYYVSEMYAINIAADECGIESWDIQHGGQGQFHKAYSNYYSVPATGYKLMPKYFWCWDQSSADSINKWASLQNFHRVKVLGNPWIEYCMNEYSKEITGKENIIIYTLANTKGKELLETYILEAIADTPNNYKWWIRLHPLESDRKVELLKSIISYNLSSKVEIDQAQILPLPVIIGICHVHISKWSGSITEAALIGKTSIIIDKFGVESYPEIIESGLAIPSLTNSARDLLSIIIG